MRSRLNLLVLAFAALAFAGCKHSDYFILSGEVQNPKSVQKVFLLKIDTIGTGTHPVVIDSAALSDQGKFSFKQSTPYPNMYKLKIGGNTYDLIASNGDDVGFKTDLLDTTNTYMISGSIDSEHIREFNKISNFYGKITEQITQDYQAKKQKLSGASADSLLKASLVLYKKSQKDYGTAVFKFMMDNKTSLAAFYAASSLDPVQYEGQLITYADNIKNTFAGNPVIAQFLKHMEDVAPLSVGHKPPAINLTGIDNKPVSLDDYKGKYVIIDFWASWCQPCRMENPNVVKLYNQFKDKGLNILGFSLDNNRENWEAAIKADHLDWKQVSEFKSFEAPTVRKYMVEAIPANFIIGPDGNIVAKNVMGADLEEFLNKTFGK